MRDFLPSDVRKRNYVIGIIKEVYESYGFEPLETPAVENIETLMGKYGEEGNQLIFKILKRRDAFWEELEDFAEKVKNGSYDDDNPIYPPSIENSFCDLALRYDLTVPLARVVGNNKNDLPKFFKRYQIQPVWRADRPARGRFREFYQCDVDAIGSSSMVVEAELISAVSEILERLGFRDFEIRLNHRLLLDAMMINATIEREKRSNVLIALDKLDKIGKDGVKEELTRLNIPENSIETLFYLTTNKDFFSVGKMERYVPSTDNFAVNCEMLEHLCQYFKDFPSNSAQNIVANEAFGKLKKIVDLTRDASGRNHLKIDASLARGLSYYTGTIMEINVPDLAGSLGGGGRYDGLIGMFGKEQIPACGFSLGLERILVVMDERNMFPPEIAASTPAEVMVTIWNEETIGESLKLANELRSQGLRVAVYPEADKFGKQLKYANSINVPFVCKISEEEVEESKVKLIDMMSGEEWKLAPTEIGKEALNKARKST